MIGKTILHYKILAKLGEGGMGVVYKAEDTKLERIVAIKFLPHHIAANAEERERFKIEAQAAAALNHPNIATIHAIEEVDGEMFIVMEFIDGQELRKLLIDNGQLSIDNCLNYATQIAEGLKAAHTKGITHRDIKSSNIMVTESGQVKIMDFGLAKIAGGAQLTKDHSTLGTAAYMSPEQARGEKVDHRTDIWALGVVLYEMLTGQLPFRGVYEQAVIYSILNEQAEPITNLRSDTPQALQQITNKALAKKVNERYQSINEMLHVLRQSGNQIFVAERSPAVVSRKSKRSVLYAAAAGLVILLLAGIIYFRQPAELVSQINAIAVLPLTNLSGDPNKEFFADGMTEALISDLGQIEALRVISRTSVMQYKNLIKPLPEIAKELNVDAVVEGSVQSSGDQVEINVRLIEATTEQRLWSKSYGRELRDVLTLQREVALAIAREINAQVTMEERALLEKNRTVDPKAYELYLWGRNFRDKETPENIKQAVDYFERAITIDPNFAPAHADLIVPYIISGGFGVLPVEEAKSKARQAAAKALQLDQMNAEAHTGLGVIREFFDWNWSDAEEEFRQAVELNPGSRASHYEYGLFLIRMGKTEEGLAELKRAQEVDPLSEAMNANAAYAYIYNRQNDQAIEQCKKTLTFFPNSSVTHLMLGQAYFLKRMYEEAIGVLETEVTASAGIDEVRFGFLGSAYALSGHSDKALKMLEESRQDGSRYSMAMIYTSLGEKDKALPLLKQAYDERSPFLVYILRNPIFDPLHSEPRFQALLKKMSLEK